jgi:hypothetical protein
MSIWVRVILGYLGFSMERHPVHHTVESREKKENLRHNKLKKAYLDRAFDESRSVMIARKNQK